MNSVDANMLIEGVKASRTLTALHMSGNQIDQKTKVGLIQQLRADFERELIPNSLNTCEIPIRLKSEDSRRVITPRGKYEASAQPHFGTRMPHLNIRDSKGNPHRVHKDDLANIYKPTKARDEYMLKIKSNITFTRVLGYEEIPNAQQWKSNEQCWVCQRWMVQTFQIDVRQLEEICRTDDLKFVSGEIGELGSMGLLASFNGWRVLSFEQVDGNVYKLKTLVPPGQHAFYVVFNEKVWISKLHSTIKQGQVYVNMFKVNKRAFDVSLKFAENVYRPRVFNKEFSVYKQFLEDDERRVTAMFNNDLKYAKISRFIKNSEEYQEVCQLLLENFVQIKEIFDYYAATSSYPTIGMLDFANYCKECNMIDNRYLNTSAIDRLFIATNYEVKEVQDNPNNSLCRYEFFELIARIAHTKFQDYRDWRPVQALQKLLDEYVFAHSKRSGARQFREDFLYNLDANDIFEANQVEIKQVFDKYKEPEGAWLRFDTILELCEFCEFEARGEDLQKCYAFSKMSILDQNQSQEDHDKLKLVEFYIFIGHLANLFYPDGTFGSKLTRTLDNLLSPHNIRRRDVKHVLHQAESEESEDD